MPNIGSILKEEITRLARRSMSPLYRPHKHDVAALKRALAQQKRLNAKLLKDNTRLLADLNGRLAAPVHASAEEVEHARLSPRSIHSQRNRLGLSQNDFARLLGVTGGAVVGWEGGRSKPRTAAKAALVALRKLGKREARTRLEALVGGNGHGRSRAHVSLRGKRRSGRASANR